MKTKKTKGLTLIELVVTIGVMTVIVVAASSTVVAALQMYVTHQRLQDHQVQARFALLAISRDIHMADPDPERSIHIQNNVITIPVITQGGQSRYIRYSLGTTANSNGTFDMVRTWHETPAGAALSPDPTDWPVRFTGAELSTININWVTADGAIGANTSPTPTHSWVRIHLTTDNRNGEATISVSSTLSTQRLLPRE